MKKWAKEIKKLSSTNCFEYDPQVYIETVSVERLINDIQKAKEFNKKIRTENWEIVDNDIDNACVYYAAELLVSVAYDIGEKNGK